MILREVKKADVNEVRKGSVIVIITIILGLILATTFIQRETAINAIEIARDLEKVSAAYSVKIEDYDKLEGTKHEYINAATGKEKYGDLNYIYKVEVFNNKEDALFRKEYLNKKQFKLEETITKKDFGFLYDEYINKGIKEEIVVYNNVLLRVNLSYEEAKDKIISTFKTAVLNYKTSNKNNKNKKEFENFKNNKLISLNSEVTKEKDNLIKEHTDILNKHILELNSCTVENLVAIKKDVNRYNDVVILKDLYNKALKEVEKATNRINKEKETKVNNINKEIIKISKSLNSKDLENLENTIDSLSDAQFKNEKVKWQKNISDIKKKLKNKEISDYKNKCKSYSYKAISRNPEKYKGSYAYFRGEVVQVLEYGDSVTLRVNVTQSPYGYYWDDTVYVTYYNYDKNNRILEDDIIKMYGTLEGTKTYESIFGASITIPRLDAKYIIVE